MIWSAAAALGCLAVTLGNSIFWVLRFTYLTIYDFTFMPCAFNIFRGQYKYMVTYGFLHSLVVGIISLVQAYASYYNPRLSFHMNGSLQMVSLIASLVYAHLLVIMYKYRHLHITHSALMEYQSSYFMNGLTIVVNFLIALYACFLFTCERFWLGMHRDYPIGSDMRYYHTFEVGLYVIMGMSVCMLILQLFRICKRWYRIHKVNWEPDHTPHYYFRQHVSKYNLPYFLNDLFLVYLPLMYLLIRANATQVLNVYDIIAKCLLIAHTASFIITYMVKIRMAKKQCGDLEVRCGCFRCTPNWKNPLLNCRTSTRILEIIEFCTPRKNNRRNGGGQRPQGETGFELREIVGGGAAATTTRTTTEANAHEHPTETTPAMETTRGRVSEDV